MLVALSLSPVSGGAELAERPKRVLILESFGRNLAPWNTITPVFGLFEEQLGHGIVGGRLFSGQVIGREAARVAARVLCGELAGKIPPLVIEASPPTFDWRELQRWQIDERRLPPGSVVRFHQSSAWERYRWYLIATAGILLAQALTITALLAQRTQRRRAEANLRENQQFMEQTTQRALSRRLIETQEEERKRMAAELHDGLGQDLLVIKNRAMLGLRDAKAAPEAAEQFQEISRVASASLAEVQQISHGLRPFQLDRLGLSKALRAMVNNLAAGSGLRCVAEVDTIDGLLASPMEIHCYRIVQELLNNVVKHSRASEARVRASRNNGTILLVVEDDGCGFNLGAARERAAGMGLTDIADRALILEGSLRCESRHAEGTRWTIEIPVTEKGPS